MLTKHFFKTLTIFTLMIALGLLGVYFLNSLDQDDIPGSEFAETAEVAE